MKRILVSLVTLLLLIGCQRTPEQPLIVPKDQELMLEKAAATQKPEEPYTPPAAPERWTFEQQSSNFTYHADADVSVPAVPLPTVWVRAQGLPQETVYRLFSLLSQGEELKLPHVQTKAEIEESIRAYTELLEQGPDQDSDMSKEEYDEGLLQELDYLKEAYKTAPEESPDRISDGTYAVEKSGKTGTETLVLSTSNLNREINVHSFPQADERSSFAYYRHLRGRSDYSMANARKVDAAAMQDDPFYQKAMNEVQAVLDAIGDPFEVAAVYLIDDAAYGNVDGIVHDAEHRALCVDCRRLVNGAPAAYDVSGAARKDPKSYAIPWPVESLRLVVDEEGIVSVSWKNMVTVLETASPVTNLLPFDQAAAVAEKMLPILYNPTGWEDLRSVDIDIVHVGLELIRIREQNNTGELKGLLVPAWVFYGTIRMTDASGFQDYANYGMKSGYDHYRGEEILLCLNAVDGSVIDPLLGY